MPAAWVSAPSVTMWVHHEHHRKGFLAEGSCLCPKLTASGRQGDRVGSRYFLGGVREADPSKTKDTPAQQQ